jgi:hypothetical protein
MGSWTNTKTAGKIDPGDTVHLCGTITTSLAAQASGADGLPITVLWEDGAKLSQPICNGSNGCFNTSGHTYLILDGGTNGVIENTKSGTAFGSAGTGSTAIVANGCDHCEFLHLTVQNIYVKAANNTHDPGLDDTQERCITFSGSEISLHDNVFHDAGWCINQSYKDGDANVRLYNNDIYNINHGWTPATSGLGPSGPFYFYGNHIHDYAMWDASDNFAHHDGIHCFTCHGSGCDGQGAHINGGIWIYDNLFDGDVGTHMTGHIFMEGGTGAGRTPCVDDSSAINVFNNVFIGNHTTGGLLQLYRGSGGVVYNNTFISSEVADSGNTCLSLGRGSPSALSKVNNNFFAGCPVLVSIQTTFASVANDYDYNGYAACTSFNCFTASGPWMSDTGSYATWKTDCGTCDTHSVTALTANGGVDAKGKPQAGSVVIGAGENLTARCMGDMAPLCQDKSGTPRPASGAWTIGAYQL